MRSRQSRSATALAVVLAFAASVRVHSQDVQKQPPVVVANPETKLDITPAATPIVNIAKPREDGTSYNVFTRLNVGREGLIFNNSPKIGSTILGGQILANPNLVRTGTSARLILNEVIGGTRSDLNGPIEIFGPKAGLIIANQAGITCDGCGFFNVERATLTTGRAAFDRAGAFSGLSVDGGAVNIAGKGLLAGNVDFFDIVAQTTSLNASLYARDLLVSGGTGDFDYRNRTATARGTGSPKVAIDSSLLGGMYANRIRLIGNGTGVGVNLSGVATALEGSLEITADGDIAVRNAVAASNAQIRSSAGNVEIGEQLYAGGQVRIDAAGSIAQKGSFLAAARNLELQSGGSVILAGSGIFAGLGNNGLNSLGSINIRAAGDVKANVGQAIATQELNIAGRNIEFGPEGAISAKGIELAASEHLNLASQIRSSANLTANGRVIDISGVVSADNRLALNAGAMSITGDAIGIAGVDVKVTGDFQLGLSKSLQSGGALSISAASIDNRGQITGIGATKIQSLADFKNSGAILAGDTLSLDVGRNALLGGTTNANGATTITVGRTATISGAVGSAKDISLKSAAIFLGGTLSGGGALNLQSSGALETAASSTLVTDRALTVKAGSATFGGYASAGGAFDLTSAESIILGGQLHANGKLGLVGKSFVLTGTAVTNGSADLLVDNSAVLDGTISAEGNLRIDAGTLATGSDSKILSGSDISAFLKNNFSHQGVISGKSLGLSSGSSISNEGQIFAKANLTLNSQVELLNHGAIETGGIATLTSDKINSDGRIVGIGGLAFTGSDIALGKSSNVQSGSALRIDAARSLSTDGSILSVRTADIRSAGNFTQSAAISVGESAKVDVGGAFIHQGILQAGGRLDISGASIEGSGNFASNNDILLRARAGVIDFGGNLTAVGHLIFQSPANIFLRGTIEAGDTLSFSAKNLLIGGAITALGGISGSLDGRASILASGQLRSGGDVSIRLADFENSGLVASQENIDIHASRDILNAGQLISQKATSLLAGRHFVQDSILQTNGALVVNAGGTITANGTSIAGASLNFKSDNLVANGILASDGLVDIATRGAQDFSRNTVVVGKSGVSLNSDGAIHLAGQLSANGDVSVNATQSLFLEGLLESAGAVNLSAANLNLPGNLKALGGVAANAQTDIILAGNISALGAITLSAQNVDAAAGSSIVGNDKIDLNVENNASLAGLISSGKDVRFQSRNIRHSGQVLANGSLSIIAGEGFGNSGELQSGSTLSLTAGLLDIGGTALANGNVKLDANVINFTGRLSSNEAIESISNSFVSDGTITALGGIHIATAEDMLLSLKSVLETNAIVTLDGRDIGLSGRIAGRDGLAFSARRDFANRGELLTGGDLQISAGHSAFISGVASANGQTQLNAADIITLGGDLFSFRKFSATGRKMVFAGNISGGDAINIAAIDGIDLLRSSSILAEGPLAFASAGAVLADGVIATRGDISLQSDAALLLGGTLSAGGNITAQSVAISAASEAKVIANGRINFDAQEILQNAGTISAGDIELRSGVEFNNLGSIFGDQKITISAADFSTAGVIAGNGAVTLTGQDISFARSSDLQVGGSLTVTASGNLETNGTLLAIGGADLSATNQFVQNAAIRLGDGGGRLVADGSLIQNGVIETNGNLSLFGGAIAGAGALLSAGSIALQAGAGGIDYAGSVGATKDISFKATSAIRLAGSVATDDVARFDTSILTLDAIVSAGGGVAMDNVNTLNIGTGGGLISGRDLFLRYADFNNLGTLASKGLIDIEATGSGKNAGTLIAGSELNIRTGGVLENSGTLSSTGALTIAAGGSILNDGLIQSEGLISLAGASMDLRGTLVSLGGIDLSSADNILVTGLISAGQSADFAARNFAIGSTGRVVGGDVLTVNTAELLENRGIVAAENAINIGSGSISMLTGSIMQSAGSASLGALGDIRLEGDLHANEVLALNSGADLSLKGTVTGNDAIALLGKKIGIAGTVHSDKLLSLSGAEIANLGTLIGLDGVTVQANDIFDNDAIGRVLTDGSIKITGGNIQTAGLLQSGLDIEASVAGLANLGGTLLAGNDLKINAADIVSSAIIQAGRNAEFAGIGNLEFTAASDIVAAEALNISSHGNFKNSGGIGSLGTVDIEAVGSLQNSGSVLSTYALALRGGSVELAGVVSSNDAISVSAKNDLKLEGTVSARLAGEISGATIDIGAPGRLAVAGNLTVAGVGFIQNSGTVVSDADISLSSSGEVRTNGVISAGGNLSFVAARDLNLGGENFAGKLASANASDIVVDGLLIGGPEGVKINSRTFTLGALGEVQSGGLLDVTSASTLVTNGKLLAIGDINLTAKNATLNGAIASHKQIKMASASAAISAEITGIEGIDLGASGLLQLTSLATLASQQTVRLSGDNIAAAGTISGDGAVRIDARSAYNGTGEIQSLGNIDIRSGGTLTHEGVLAAVGNIALTGGATTISGIIDSASDVHVVATDLVFDGQLSGKNTFIDARDIVASQNSLLFSNEAMSIVATGSAQLGGTIGATRALTIDAVGDLNLNGIAQSLNGDATVAGRNVSLSGNLLSGGKITLSAGQAFTLSGVLSAKDVTDIDATDIELRSSGRLVSDENITLRALNAITNAGEIGTGKFLDLNATQNLTNSGLLSSGAGILLSSALVNAGGTVETTGPLSLNGGIVNVTGNLLSVGAMSLSSTAGDMRIDGTLASLEGDVALAASRDIFVNGQTTAKKVLTANARDVVVNALLFGEERASVNATRNIAVGNSAVLASDGRIDIGFGEAIDLRGTVSAGKDLSLLASQDMTLGGTLISGGTLTLGGRDLTLDGVVSGRNGISANGRNITVGTTGDLQSENALLLNATASLAINGDVVTLGNGSFSGTGGIQIGSSANVQGRGSLSFLSAGDFHNAGTLVSEAAIVANANLVDVGGSLFSGGAISLNAGDTLAVNGFLSADEGDISLNAANTTLSGQIFGGKNVRLRGGTGVITGKVTGFEGVDLETTGALTMAGANSLVAANGLIRLAGNAITTAGAVNSNAAISILAGTSFQGDGFIGGHGVTITSNGTLISGKIASKSNINLSGITTRISGIVESDAAVTVGGTSLIVDSVLAGAALTLNGGTITTNSGSTLVSGGALNIAASGTVSTAGSMEAVGNITINSDTNITQNAALRSNGNIDLTAIGQLTSNGSTEAVGSLKLRGGSITTGGALLANDALSLTSLSGDIIVNAAISSAKKVAIDASRDVKLNAIVFGKTGGSLGAQRNSSLAANAGLITDAALTINAQTLNNAGVLSAGVAGLAATFSGDVVNNGSLLSGGGVTLNSGGFTSTNAIQAAGSISLTAANAAISGQVASDTNVTIKTTAGALNVNGNVFSQIVELETVGGNLQLGASGFLQAQTNSKLTTNANAIIDGDILSNELVEILANNGALNTGANASIRTGGAAKFSAKNALTHSGSVEAVGTITLTGGNISSNILLSDGGINLTSTGPVVINGEASGRSVVDIKSTESTLTINSAGLVRSQIADVKLSSTQALRNDGIIVGQTGVDASAGGSVLTNNGQMIANAGTLVLSANQLDLGGTAFGNNLVNLDGATINVTGNVGAETSLSVTGGNLTIGTTGLLQSNGGASLTTSGLTVNGTLRTLLGNMVVSGTTLNVNNGGRVESGGALNMTATGTLSNNGLIVSSGALTLSGNVLNLGGITSSGATASFGGSALNIAGIVEARGPLTINNGAVNLTNPSAVLRSLEGIGIMTSTLTNAGAIEALQPISINASAALTTSGSIVSNNGLTLQTDGVATLGGTLVSGGALSVTGATISQSGLISAIDNLSLTANSGGIAVGGALVGQKAVTLSATGQTITFNPTAEVFGKDSVYASSSNISNSGKILSQGNITLAAANILTQTGQLTAGSLANLSGGSKIDLGGQLDAGAVTLTAPTLNVTGALVANGAVTLDASNSVSVSGSVTGGSISLNGSGTDFQITAPGRVVSGGNVTLTGIKNLTVEGLLSAADNLTATYGGVAHVSGRIEARHDITLISTAPSAPISGATLIVPGQIVAGRDLTITGGATTISGTVYGDQNVNISTVSHFVDSSNFAHSLDVTGSGALASGGNLDVKVIGDLNVLGPNASLSAGGNVILNALTHNISGRIVAKDDVIFTNGASLSGAAVSIPDSGINLFSGGTVQAGRVVSIDAGPLRDVAFAAGSSIISNDGISVTGRNVDSLGTVAAAKLIDFSSPGNITLGGLVQSGDRITAHAEQVLSVLAQGRVETIGNARTTGISRDQGANSNIDLLSRDVLTNAGTIFSDGSIFLNANNALTNGGTITGNVSVIAQSNNDDVENLGTITGNTLGIFQNIAFHNIGNFVAANNLLIDAPEITNSGLIGAGNNLTLQSGSNIINTGTLFAGNNLTLTAAGQVHNDKGTMLALGNIAISAAELINDSARIESLGGDVSITSANVVNRIKDLVIVAGGSIAEGYYRTDIAGKPITENGPQEFSPLDCGSTGGANPVSGTVNCESIGGSIAAFTVIQSFVSQTTNIVYNAGFYSFFLGSPATGSITTNSGPSQIVAARNVIINGGTNGTVTNRNSSILAGQNISITTGTLNNESTTVQTETGDVLLPAIIRAGGTVSIVANQVNNGTVQNNGGFSSGPNGSFNTSQGPGATGQGGIGSAAGPVSQNSGLNGTAGPADGPGSRNGSAGNGFVIGNGPGGTRVSNAGNSGTGAGNFSGPNGGGFAPSSGTAGNASGVSNVPSSVNGVGGVTDGSIAAGVGGLPNGNGGFDGGSINNGTPGGNQGAVNIAGFDVNRVVLQPAGSGNLPNGAGAGGQAANPNGAVINGPGNVGSAGSGTAQADAVLTDGLADIAVGGGNGGGSVGTAPTSITDTTVTAHLVDGFDGQTVGITSVGATSAAITADSGLSGTTSPAGQQLDALQNVDAVGAPQAAATSTTGQAAATAGLLDGFNGIAIPGIIASNGDAGSFVFDFLRQFDLVNGANGGFGFASGNGLFTFNDSPDADVLFSTNRGFGDFSGLFDSDYFFDQLDIDRGTHFTRLGDGFFESQLISQQVRAATSQAQLPQFGTSLAQAEGLMASAVKQQKALQLSVGVALTASQVSALTESLVWWVSAKVNGRNALVPVVYLAKNDQKSITNGALIAGTNVVANVAGNITNSGTISGANLVSLTAGNDFINSSGGLVSGGTVGIRAGNDIVNKAGASITGGDVFLTAGRDIVMSSTIDTATSSTRENLGGKRFASETVATQTATGSTLSATGNLVMNAGRDISISFGNVSAGGDAALTAGRDVLVTGVTTTDRSDAAWKTGKNTYGTSSSSEETFHGSVIKVGGDLGISAGRDIGIIGSTIKVGDDLSMQAGGNITIGAAQTQSRESLDERLSKKIRTNQIDTTATTHVLSDISAGGNIGISTPGALTVAGANIAAGDVLAINAGTVRVTGVIDEVAQDTNRVVKSGGLLSSKKTTTATSMVDQSVIGSTLEGDRVAITSLGDVSIKGSNVVATGNLAINAGGMIDIGTMVEEDSSSNSVKVKKSGLSLSGGGLFLGVAKNRNDTTLDTSTNVGSLIGSATGNVTLNADGALKITGSDVVAPGTVNLIGDSVTIAHAIDTATSTSLSKSSSFGVSVKAYENVSGAVNSVSGLVGRVGEIGQGAVGTAISGLSETLRTVAAVQAAMTNTAGVTASLGFSKSKTTSETQESAVSGSTITGGNVNIVAHGSDIAIRGSDVASAGDINLMAARDLVVESGQNILDTQTKSKSSGASIGVQVGVAVVGGVTASASVGVNSSRSSSNSSETTQVNSTVTAADTLRIVTGGDTTLRGAVVEGRDVIAAIGGDLNIHSVQDIASRESSSVGGSVGLTAAPGVGLGANASFNVGSGKSNSAIVTEQTALLARGGSLNVNVVGNTDLKGGLIAALNGQGNDSGRLSLVTGTLTASDIQDSARSKDISAGISESVNNVTDRNTRGAELPVIDGSYASSIFKQDTKATIGQGVTSVAVPDANVTFNRNIDQAQVVTKDSQTGFTVYIDPAAIKEVVALVKGDKENSVILRGVEEIGKDPTKIVKEAIKEAKSLHDGVSQSGSLETLVAQLPNLLGIKRNPTRAEAQAEFEKLAKQRTEAGIAAYEKEVGRPATNEERAMIASIAKNVASAMVGISVKGMTDLDRLAEPLGSNPTSSSKILVDGEEVVTGDWYAMAPGDQLLSTAAKAGKWINSVDPNDREAVEKSMDVVFGGPVKAVVGWTIEYGLEKAAKENPELVGELARLANEAGIWATDKISRDDEQTVRDNNAADKDDVAAGRMPATYIDNIFAAADLILGVDIPGVGRGKLPKGDLPKTKQPSIQEFKAHHDGFVNDAANEYREKGYDIPNTRQPTFRDSCGISYCRTDLIGKGPDGKVVVFEIKTGDAELSIRQSEIYPQIRDGNAIPRGRVAEALGLRPGIPLKDQDYPNGIEIIEIIKPGLGK